MQTFASPLEKVQLPGCDAPIFMKRDDLLHPIASGNKWRKLKYLIEDLREQGFQELATFGGAYSNHMIATACAGASLGIKTHCFVRGHEPMDSHYLGLAKMHGMSIIQVNRTNYKDFQGNLCSNCESLTRQLPGGQLHYQYTVTATPVIEMLFFAH